MKVKSLVELMYENEKAQYVCLQDVNENVLFLGTVRELRLNHPKSLKAEVLQMYTERYGAFNGVSGLTITIYQKLCKIYSCPI